MKLGTTAQKEKAIAIMKRMNIYTPYITSFQEQHNPERMPASKSVSGLPSFGPYVCTLAFLSAAYPFHSRSP